MKPIPCSFTKDGYLHEEIQRVGDVVLYHCSRPDGSCEHWEVVRLRIDPAKTWSDGRTTEAHEALPSPEQWGVSGWTYSQASHRDPIQAAHQKAKRL